MTCGLPQDQIDAISATTGLSIATLPLRYLGVPLCPQKLSIKNCAPLIQQIKGKVNSLSLRSLSFAGRLLMLKSAINGITIFWTSTFILEKSCIVKIDSLCSSFLWHGSTEGSHSVKRACETITLRKSEGGLGCWNIKAWNVACALKLIWLLFTSSGSIWVAWFKQEILKGSLSNFSTTMPKERYLWFANKLLKLRHLTYDWIKSRVGRGDSVKFWTDNWSPYGDLSLFLTPCCTNSMGVPANATLQNICSNGTWNIRPARSDKQVLVQEYLSSIILTSVPDSAVWIIDEKEWTKYKTGAIYDIIRPHSPQVTWKEVVWNK